LRRTGGKKIIQKINKENEKKENAHREAAITISYLSLHEHNVSHTEVPNIS
jgi:hypothetical protein